MTHLETRDYHRSGGNVGIHLLMAYEIKNVTIEAAWVEEHNPGYFAGRRARNASRDAAASDPDVLQDMANTLNAVAMAKVQFEAAKANLDALTQHGALFAADR